MADRKPLVLTAGAVSELPPADTLLALLTSGSARLETATGGIDLLVGATSQAYSTVPGNLQLFADGSVDIEAMGSDPLYIGSFAPSTAPVHMEAVGNILILGHHATGISIEADNGPISLSSDAAITVAGPSITLPAINGTSATLSSFVNAARLVVTGSTVPANGVFLPAANTLGFSSNTTERMRILSSGRVLIGTTTDDFVTRLQVNGSISGTSITASGTVSALTLAATANVTGGNFTAAGIVSGVNVTASNTVSGAQASITNNLTAGRVTVDGNTAPTNGLYLPATNELGFSTNSTHRMRLTATGLGIGTTAPAGRLHVTNDGGANNTFWDTYENATPSAGTVFIVRRARGSAASPAAVQSGDRLGGFAFGGQFDTTPGNFGNAALIVGTAADTFTSGARGTHIDFETTPAGTAARAQAMRLNSQGRLLIGTTTTDDGNRLQVDGDVSLRTAGNGIRIKEGSNAKMGASTLVAGSVVVSTTAVTANSRIFLTPQNASGTAGSVSVSARTAGTSFTITSTSGTDTRSVAWMIMEPA